MSLHRPDELLLCERLGSRWGAAELSRLLADVRAAGRTCVAVCESILPALTHGPENALAEALLSVAASADRSGAANVFHNSAHLCDVGLIWINLAVLNNRLPSPPKWCDLDEQTVLLGACAAFGHDIGHDGRGSHVASGPSGRATHDSFRMESRTADIVAHILRQHGVGEPHIVAARAIILATDIVDGYAVLESCLAARFEQARRSPIREFAAFEHPATLLSAVILRDADILQSAGLTARDHDQQTAALERELGMPTPFTPEETEQFFGQVLGGRFLSPPGRQFQSHLDALRALNRHRMADDRLRALTLDAVEKKLAAR